MSKKFFFFIILSILSITYLLDCTDFYDDTCGGHNASYNLQCHKFKTNPKCSEVEVDAGCKIDDNDKCTKTEANSNNYNCYFINNKDICRKITIDTGCKIDTTSSEPDCQKDNVKETEKCTFIDNKKTCAKKNKECSEFGTNECNKHGDTCKKIKINSYLNDYHRCQIVSIDQKCDINTDGDCISKSGAELQNYEKCAYNSDYTECKITNKECIEMDTSHCADCKTSPEGTHCRQVDNQAKCLNVQIDTGCKVEGGKCVKDSNENNKNQCLFNLSYTGCIFYEVDSKCKLDETHDCVDDGLTDTEKKCHFDSEKNTVCKPTEKVCGDYDSASCEQGKVSDTNTKKCSWKDGKCQEFTIDHYCTVNEGKCEKRRKFLILNLECSINVFLIMREKHVPENQINVIVITKNVVSVILALVYLVILIASMYILMSIVKLVVIILVLIKLFLVVMKNVDNICKVFTNVAKKKLKLVKTMMIKLLAIMQKIVLILIIIVIHIEKMIIVK